MNVVRIAGFVLLGEAVLDHCGNRFGLSILGIGECRGRRMDDVIIEL